MEHLALRRRMRPVGRPPRPLPVRAPWVSRWTAFLGRWLLVRSVLRNFGEQVIRWRESHPDQLRCDFEFFAVTAVIACEGGWDYFLGAEAGDRSVVERADQFEVHHD